ncbi:cyclin-K-like [Haliotis rubra]|uniref:cyclin-K-like n=1 Tax=Haliotis rubra TaxID=36100 RepID=UPI001EE5C560|nr:cyclin-K-like [Haliotis rubra]
MAMPAAGTDPPEETELVKPVASKRREAFKPDLSGPYKRLCQPNAVVTTANVFGDELGKKIEDITDSKHLTSKLSGERNKLQGGKHRRFAPYQRPNQQSSTAYAQREGKANRGTPMAPVIMVKSVKQQNVNMRSVQVILLLQKTPPLTPNLHPTTAPSHPPPSQTPHTSSPPPHHPTISPPPLPQQPTTIPTIAPSQPPHHRTTQHSTTIPPHHHPHHHTIPPPSHHLTTIPTATQ